MNRTFAANSKLFTTVFHSPYTDLPTIPDDLSIPQFFLDYNHPSRPIRPENSPWLIDDDTDRSLSLEQIRARTYALANILKSRWNIGENDVVGIFSSNHIDFPIILWAAHRLGAAVTSANPIFSADELTYQLTTVKASILFAHESAYSTALAAAKSSGISQDRVILIRPCNETRPSPVALTLDNVIAEGLVLDRTFVERKLRPGEGKTKIALFNFSSGTTGRPKAVAISHYSVIANALQMSTMYRVNDPSVPLVLRRWMAGSVALNVLPLFHIYGIVVNLHNMLFCGCSVVVVPKFNFRGMLKTITRYRISSLFLVPPMVVMLCKNPAVQDFDLSCIRSVMIGAAPLSSELTQQLIRILPASNIFQAYGLTETATTVTMGPLAQQVSTLGSAGRLLPGVVARVVKSDGSDATFGEEGEVVIKSPSNALRYSNNEEATKATFIDGWVWTGDKGYINEKYELFIVDRLKEIMKVRGFQVAPAELEGHLLDHQFVSDVCVVGVPDEYSGELPFAFIVPNAEAAEMIKKGATGTAKIKAVISKHVSDAKAPYKHITGGIEFVDVVPKNPSGKLLRRLLRDKAREIRARTVTEEQSAKAKL